MIAVLFDLSGTIATDEVVVRDTFLATCALEHERRQVTPEELGARP